MEIIEVDDNSRGETTVTITLDKQIEGINEIIKRARRALEIWIIRNDR
jgi:hypothetical protein